MKNILCVDDEECVVEFLKRLLTSAGYSVVGSEDSTQTEALVEQKAFDLVILDVEMPEKDGLEVFDDLKTKNDKLPMLFVTGRPHSFDWDSPEKAERWKNGFIDGLTDILYKPFRNDDLLSKVEGLVGPA